MEDYNKLIDVIILKEWKMMKGLRGRRRKKDLGHFEQMGKEIEGLKNKK